MSRFPGSSTILGEPFPSTDGKYRYIKFQRVDVYRRMVSWIKRADGNLRIKLSMESDEVKDPVFNGEDEASLDRIPYQPDWCYCFHTPFRVD
ncbi:MAG TPA: hypothetical protein VNK81_05185 [Thermodesulfobacteriota bacterium]|jgi:hypothetical protein|nr:hypothetical protein [Thermodesulfobacteriota bacterium]